MEERRTFCRICFGSCGLIVRLDEARRIVSVRGDPAHPLTRGYACSKGVASGEMHASPRRVLRPLKRVDGSFVEIGVEQALDEIAGRLSGSIGRHGTESHAIYQGMGGSLNAAVRVVLRGWLDALGSRSYYSSMTLDQSAKWVSFERLGRWAAGNVPFDQADVWMGFGFNPLVSVSGALSGFDAYHPLQRLRDAKARGMKLIVIDPRKTETARMADLHLQPVPGEDAAIAAGLLRLILEKGSEDKGFCADHADGLEVLRAAVAPFTPQHVAARAGIEAPELEAAAAMFLAARRGGAFTGTGPNMSPFSNLSQHLVDAINVVCGRYPRAGDAVANPGVLGPRRSVHAEPVPPGRSFETSGMLFGQKMTGALGEAILSGEVRSLFVVGGNLASAMPDQAKTQRALEALDLLVCVDPMLNATARLADYVLPPRMMFERDDMTMVHNERNYFPVPFAQYAPAIAAEPEGAELIDDHALFWGLAKRLGLTLRYGGQALDGEHCPSALELLALTAAAGQVPFAEVMVREGGAAFDVAPQVIEPARPGAGRFELFPDDVAAEFAAMAEGTPADPAYPLRLIVRRMREVMNSFGREIPSVQRRRPANLLHLHPQDLAALALVPGDPVTLRSRHGAVETRVEADETLRPGTVSLAHGWGELPGDAHAIGVAINRLTSADEDVEPVNAMPRFSALPVRVERCTA